MRRVRKQSGGDCFPDDRLYLFAGMGRTAEFGVAGVSNWITFYNHLRPYATKRGQLTAVVCFNTNQTEQQVQAVASMCRKIVQS